MVIIHDVVRIFAEEETIRDVALAAKSYGVNFSHIPLSKRSKNPRICSLCANSIHLTLLALLSRTASSVANAG